MGTRLCREYRSDHVLTLVVAADREVHCAYGEVVPAPVNSCTQFSGLAPSRIIALRSGKRNNT